MRKIFSTLLASTAICALVSSASHAATLPVVSSGTLQLQLEANSGVISSGGSVSAWNDQSGNGFNATQATAANQPTLVMNSSPNGLEPAIVFNGNRAVQGGSPTTGSFLSGLGQLPTGSNTVFMVYTPISNPGGAGNEEIPFEWGTEGNGQMRAFYLMSPTNTIQVGFAQYGNGDIGTKYPVAGGTGQLGSWTDSASGTTSNLTFYNRTSNSLSDTLEATATATGSNPPPAGFELGGADIPTLGNYPFAGDISAILVYSGVLSSADRLAVENYLYAEYIATPEPAPVVALVGLCGMGLIGFAFRRRRIAKAAAR
jgi:hypothetical protein